MTEHRPTHPSIPPAVLARRWWILAALLGVMMMAPLDSSALNVTLPVLQRVFRVSMAHVAWVPLVYLLVITSLILPMGRLADVLGFRRLFLTGVFIFTVASALCGLAPQLGWLIAMRVLQAVGACILMALSPAITTAIFPAQERGRALGMVGMAVALGLVTGPVLGGLLTDLVGWRMIFFINVPIGLIGGIWCRRMLPPLPPTGHPRIDWGGAILAILSLGALMLAITQGQEWRWTSPVVLALFAIGAIGSGLFLLYEHRHPAPMLPLALFRNRAFAGASFAAMMNYLGQFCTVILMPMVLQGAYGYSPRTTGMIVATVSLMLLVVSPLSGWLSDHIGTRLLAVSGQGTVTIALLLLSWAVPRGYLTEILPGMALLGIGSGLFQSPNTSAIMGSVPRTHLGIGGGILASVRNLGMALGIAISSAVATAGQQAFLRTHAYLAAHAAQQGALLFGIQLGFLTGAVFMLLGTLASAVRGDTRTVG